MFFDQKYISNLYPRAAQEREGELLTDLLGGVRLEGREDHVENKCVHRDLNPNRHSNQERNFLGGHSW